MVKVLVVDDDKSIRECLSTILRPNEVLTASNGRFGIDTLVENSDIDIVFVDFNMPVMNGIEFVREVRKHSKYNQKPVILISAREREEVPIHLFNGYVQKPFKSATLHAYIRYLCLDF